MKKKAYDKMRVTDIGVTSKGKLLTLRHGQELAISLKDKSKVRGFLMNVCADGWQLEYLTIQTGACMRVLIYGKSIEAIEIGK